MFDSTFVRFDSSLHCRLIHCQLVQSLFICSLTLSLSLSLSLVIRIVLHHNFLQTIVLHSLAFTSHSCIDSSSFHLGSIQLSHSLSEMKSSSNSLSPSNESDSSTPINVPPPQEQQQALQRQSVRVACRQSLTEASASKSTRTRQSKPQPQSKPSAASKRSSRAESDAETNASSDSSLDSDCESVLGDGDSSRVYRMSSILHSSTPVKPFAILSTCIEMQYTLRSDELRSYRTEELQKLVRVPIRLIGRLTAGATSLEEHTELHCVAKDICALLHKRVGSVGRAIHAFTPAEKQRMALQVDRSVHSAIQSKR